MGADTHQSTPAPLERRPEARAFKIEDLLNELMRGRLRVPPFQRPFRWQREDALKLLDSIFRGYPIGTLLFWETNVDSAQMQFGTVSISAAERTDALMVVDGQQRIVSLARILLPPNPRTDDFALYFDLDANDFVAPPKTDVLQRDPARWLPLTEVLDSEKLFHWILQQAPENKDRRDRAVRLGKRIREYEVPAYLVRSDSEDTLREVFGRINSSGKKLKASEVFDALHGAKTRSRPSSIRQIAEELEQLRFGRIEQDKVLYRILLMILGVDITKGSSDKTLRLSKLESESAYQKTADAAQHVIQFFKQDVGIPHYALLPYKQPFVTLGKFFHHYPHPHSRSRQLLARWVWRGALNGTHGGNAVSTRRVLDQISPDSEEKAVQTLLDQTGRAIVEAPDTSLQFNFRYAASKLQALALLGLHPRDLANGEILNFGKYLDGRLHNGDLPFPAVISVSKGIDKASLQSVANRLAHPKRKGLRKALSAVSDGHILHSHGITDDTIDALNDGDLPAFFSLRTANLNSHFRAFFLRRARWQESDRPSLTSLLVSDEDV